MSHLPAPKLVSVTIALAFTLGLAGCTVAGNITTPLTQSGSSQTGGTSGVVANVAPGQLIGNARGGQQPIANGTVTLWAAGTSSGYGAGATQVGSSTTTDSSGNFNLNVGGTGTTPQCVTGQLNYITVTKGNPGGGINNAAALMAALPTPCNSITGYPGNIFVQINEATTVAAVWALQQFMSITPANGPFSGSGSPPWNIGAPATNQIGLANAFINANQLASLTTGTSGVSTLTNTVTYPVASANGGQYNSTAGTVTYTSSIAPDSNRVNLVANILSSCINSTATISISGWAMNNAGTVATFYTPTNLGATPGTTVSLAGFSAGTFLNSQTVTVSSAATGSITALNLTLAGNGYTSNPTVTIAAPPSGTTATATAVETGGVVTSLTITNPGSGYVTLPAVTISAPTGTGPVTATATSQSGGFTATVSGGTANASNSSDPGTAAVTTGSGTSSTCANLFADVVPTTAVLPTDTIQAAYDIATAPAGITEYPEAAILGGTVAAGATVAPASLYNSGTCTSGVQYCTWALAMCDSFVSGTPPFVPVTACSPGSATPTATYPTDFAIGIRWSAVDNASTPLTYGIKSGSVAVDSNGYIWTGYTGTSGGTGYPIVEWSPTGQVLQVLGANGIVSGSNTSATYTMPASTNVVLNTTSNVESSSSSPMNYGSVPTVQVLPGSYLSSAVYAIAVDTNNNAWVTDSLAGTVGSSTLSGFFPGVVFKIAPATGWSFTSGATSTTSTAGQVTPFITGATSGAIAIDGSNNLWMSTAATTGVATSGNLTLIPASGGYNTIYEGQYVSGGIFNTIQIDGNGIANGFQNTTAAGEPVFRNSVTTAETPASLTSLNLLGTNYTSSPALMPKFGAIDASNNIWMAERTSGTGQIAYFSGVPAGGGTATSVTNVHASSTSSGFINNNSFAGLQAPDAVSIDGLGNVFIFNGVVTTAGGVSELTSTGIQLTPTNAGAGMPAFGLNLYATDAGRAGSIDQSGNLWTGAGSNSYEVHMVGLAAPVTTPLATQVGNNKIGQRP